MNSYKPNTMKLYEKVALLFVRGEWLCDEGTVRSCVFVKKWRGKIYILDEYSEILCPSKREFQEPNTLSK